MIKKYINSLNVTAQESKKLRAGNNSSETRFQAHKS